MTAPAPGHIDPVAQSKPRIKAEEKVVTMGSCFAQHISTHLASSGLNYFVTEVAPSHLTEQQSKKMGFGVFSARYGNIYTPRQALQLFERSFQLREFDSHIWKCRSHLIDAFRPNIQPDGFPSEEDLIEDRTKHIACVKRLFLECDWIIFTLGLTETWMSKSDDSIFPVAPGVHGGKFNPNDHQFVNFTVEEIIADLSAFVGNIKSVNPKVKVLLTVSPVSMMATYEKRHVLVSNTYSKSALRVAADVLCKKLKNVFYFPSYEIVTSAANLSRYINDDLRTVNPIGVKHVMRVFHKHFIECKNNNKGLSASFPSYNINQSDDIICDEDLIERSLSNLKRKLQRK